MQRHFCANRTSGGAGSLIGCRRDGKPRLKTNPGNSRCRIKREELPSDSFVIVEREKSAANMFLFTATRQRHAINWLPNGFVHDERRPFDCGGRTSLLTNRPFDCARRTSLKICARKSVEPCRFVWNRKPTTVRHSPPKIFSNGCTNRPRDPNERPDSQSVDSSSPFGRWTLSQSYAACCLLVQVGACLFFVRDWSHGRDIATSAELSKTARGRYRKR